MVLPTLNLLTTSTVRKEMDGISTDEDYEAYDVIDIRREECYKMIRDHNQTEGNLKDILLS